MKIKYITTYLVIVACGLLAACTKHEEQAKLPKADVIVAKVNGITVSLYEVNATIENITGQKSPKYIDPAVRKKILESIVLSKLVAQKAEKVLPEEVKEQIQFKADYFKEQQLIRAYLNKYAKPNLVSNDKVVAYYNEHPEMFGGGTVKEYELLTTNELNEQQREKAISKLSVADKQKDWDKFAKQLSKTGLQVQYRKGKSDSHTLSRNLNAVIAATKKGSTSKPIMLESRLIIARVLSETTKQPKPLKEVADEIRKILQPIEIKKSIDEITGKLKKDASITYYEENLNK